MIAERFVVTESMKDLQHFGINTTMVLDTGFLSKRFQKLHVLIISIGASIHSFCRVDYN